MEVEALLTLLGGNTVAGVMAYMWWREVKRSAEIEQRLHDSIEARLSDLRDSGKRDAALVERFAQLSANTENVLDTVVTALGRVEQNNKVSGQGGTHA